MEKPITDEPAWEATKKRLIETLTKKVGPILPDDVWLAINRADHYYEEYQNAIVDMSDDELKPISLPLEKFPMGDVVGMGMDVAKVMEEQNKKLERATVLICDREVWQDLPEGEELSKAVMAYLIKTFKGE